MARAPKVSIATPCTANWQQMEGDARSRFCTTCQKHVHNIAELTPREVHALAQRTNGHFCAILTRRHDGSLDMKAPGWQRAAKWMMAATLGFTGVTGSAQTKPPGELVQIQKVPGARVTGLITDAIGAGVAGAEVQVLTPAGNEVAKGNADSAGRYELAGLATGEYEVRVTSPGFSRASQTLTLAGSQRRTLNVHLQVGLVGGGSVTDLRPTFRQRLAHALGRG